MSYCPHSTSIKQQKILFCLCIFLCCYVQFDGNSRNICIFIVQSLLLDKRVIKLTGKFAAVRIKMNWVIQKTQHLMLVSNFPYNLMSAAHGFGLHSERSRDQNRIVQAFVPSPSLHCGPLCQLAIAFQSYQLIFLNYYI